ncbi:MAG: hypothetical protein RLW62_08685 [Gammaproteobacteria bacterium]
MPPTAIRRPAPRDPRRLARYALFVIVPLALAVQYWLDEDVTAADLSGFSFDRTAGWTYLTETTVAPAQGRIRFTPTALAAAIRAGQNAPLFALAKYARPQGGLNPAIGVNVALEAAAATASPRDVLERGMAETEARLGGALQRTEPLTATTLSGLPAARVRYTGGDDINGGTALVVYAVIIGRTSLLIAASGTQSGADAIDAPLQAFVGSLAVERY